MTDVASRDQRTQSVHVTHLGVVGNHDRATRHQRPEDADHRTVEPDARCEQEPARDVVAVEDGPCRRRCREIRVGHLDTGRFAGRAGREDQVGGRGSGRELGRGEFGCRFFGRRDRRDVDQRDVGEQRRGRRIDHDGIQRRQCDQRTTAIGRGGRIDRHVACAGELHTHDRLDEGGGPAQRHTDARR